MDRNSAMWKQIGAATTVFAASVVAVGLRANDIALPKVDSPRRATRVLHFPDKQCLGSLYIEPESDRGWDPKHVCMFDDWDHVGMAQGHVTVPADRNTQLVVSLALEREDAAKLRTRDPRAYGDLVADRGRADPYDLSGLSSLDPNDLYALTVNALVSRVDADQRVLGPVSRLTGLKILRLHGTGVTDKGMEQLRVLRSLKGLEFSREWSIRNQGLAVLKDLPVLEYLDLDTGATDVGLKPVGQLLNLQWLRIRMGRIWGPSLAELANLPRLERLCLWGEAELSDRHIQYLEGLKDLRSLTLWGGCNRLTDASLASIGKLTRLEELYFIATTPSFTDAGIASLKGLKNLRKVDFGQAMVGDRGVQHLTALPHLESIEGGLLVTAEGMKALASLQNLKCLRVGLKEPLQGYHGPTGISYLARLSSLEELSLQGRSQSDEDLSYLEPLTGLKRLSVCGKNITDRGMASISRLRQLEHLDLGLTSVTKRGLNQLGDLRNLQALSVTLDPDMWGAPDELTLHLSPLRDLKKLRLSGFSLHEADLAFLANLNDLNDLVIEADSLSGDWLRHVRDLHALKRLYVQGLSCSESNGLAHLNGLAELCDVTLRGKISDSALTSLTDLACVWALTVHTTEPIQYQTIADLRQRLPGIEYLHVYRSPSVQGRATMQRRDRPSGKAPGSERQSPRYRGRR